MSNLSRRIDRLDRRIQRIKDSLASDLSRVKDQIHHVKQRLGDRKYSKPHPTRGTLNEYYDLKSELKKLENKKIQLETAVHRQKMGVR